MSTYYERILPTLPARNVRCLWGDTDSFFIAVDTVKTRDELIDSLGDLIDRSNYDVSSPRYSTEFKAQPGRYKDESKGQFDYTLSVSLAPKMYVLESSPIKLATGKIPPAPTTYRAKGVPRACLKSLKSDSYLRALQEQKDVYTSFKRIEQRNTQLSTQVVNKIGLSAIDNKRHFSCNIHSLPYNSIYISDECLFCKQEAEREKEKQLCKELYESLLAEGKSEEVASTKAYELAMDLAAKAKLDEMELDRDLIGRAAKRLKTN